MAPDDGDAAEARSDPADADPEVMASLDPAADDAELVIADLSREEAWLAADADQAPVLREWC